MYPDNRHQQHQSGFTLVEIMVGLAIGMLATIVIMQVISAFETQKRTTTGLADAQTNGSVALYNIGRELQLAGYGMMPVQNSPLSCTTLNINGVADTTTPNRLSPVVITDGTSDTITIRYADSSTGGIPLEIKGISGVDVTVADNFSCQVGNRAISTSEDGLTCEMTGVAAASAATPTTITLDNAVTGKEIACLGAWNEIVYSVNNGNLQRDGQDIVADIVNIQAQYGISLAANSNSIDAWVDPSASSGWNAPDTAMRNRIKAIRIAIVARNPKLELTDVSNSCSSLNAASSPTGLCAWAGTTTSPAPSIDLSGDANWKRYRYRVFETIVPLRNVIWSKNTL
ncbi:MAG: PilW family protein [Halothiobacillaceae bacterium]|nr:PilW family protein [Halothiobacillaceae bacterium]